ncbi:uncharacterized protein PAC_12986 [Phialocephala subalpina]|uniref:Xylanolytic transcriptional activator regulatory domain-containing protein n=1 Tax=Phialocephala subalpina TaxID=576137 RepID=A0A1L7XDG5_9HELO|nr:uncharacterized protein PAC_12986 [Phialocephala subalpina]
MQGDVDRVAVIESSAALEIMFKIVDQLLKGHVYRFGLNPFMLCIWLTVLSDETPIVIADYTALQGRVNRLDDMLTDLGQETSTGSDAINQNDVHGLSNNLGHLYIGPQSKSRYVSPDFFAMISQEITEINHLLQQQQQYMIDPTLFAKDEERDLTPQSRLARQDSMSTDTSDAQHKNIKRQLLGDIFLQQPEWMSSDDNTPKSRRTTTRIPSPGFILDDLPSKEQCEALIWAYMEGYHTVSPFFHGPSFLQQARKYIERNTASDADIDIHFITLLMAVLFAGCAISSRRRLSELFGFQAREDLSSRFYQKAVRAIRLTNFPQTPSVHTLAAFIIVDTIWLREEQPLACCSFVGLAARVAQMLGIHKDPSCFPDLSPIDVQVRRQLWWNLVAIDAQVALAAGLPPIIDCTNCDVQMFNEIPEDEMSLDAQNLETTSRRKSVMGLLVAGKVEFYRKASEILHVIHSSHFSREDVDSILEITHQNAADLASRQNQISEIEATLSSPISMSGSGIDDTDRLRESQSNPVLARFAKAVLSLYTVKPYAIIQGPVRRQNLDSYLLEKDSLAIEGCRRYLHTFLSITQSHAFQPWHWCWPGQHQPLHSIMTLLLDLSQNPSSPTAKSTRQLIDMAIFMCGPQENHGIQSSEDWQVDGRPLGVSGSKAWEFIRRVRERVWIARGLDPGILNCPERVEDIDMEGMGESQTEVQGGVEVDMGMEDPNGLFWNPGDVGGGEDLFNIGINGDFSFDPSLFFTGEVGGQGGSDWTQEQGFGE